MFLFSDYCEICTVTYNYILHFENLEREEPHLIRRLGADHLLNTKHENVNSKQGYSESELIEKYFSILDPTDIDKLFNIYKQDFYSFGYKKLLT